MDLSLLTYTSFTSPRFVVDLNFLHQRVSTWPHWTVHVPGKYHYLHIWSHCGDSTSC